MKLTKITVFIFLVVEYVDYSQGKTNKAKEDLNKENNTTPTSHFISKLTTTYNDNNSEGNFLSDVWDYKHLKIASIPFSNATTGIGMSF